MATLRILLQNSKNAHLFQTNASFASFAKLMEYKKYYKTLGIPENSDQEEIRKAYLKLVKKYHPDSGTKEADANKFSEIDRAFKILINKKSKERWEVEEEKIQEHDIKHIAPQHRQYLSYDGVGFGSPFQRHKQYAKARAMQAAENVLQHQISKLSAEEGALLDKAPVKHKIKTKYGFDRLVEDLIQESMSNGDFSNLSGIGKPLPSHQNINPYVDFVTHKLNEVLIDNGFTPEWITLQKEIREEVEDLKRCLWNERSYLGSYPLSSEDTVLWDDTLCKYVKTVEDINKKISKFNLVVPIIDKQMIQIDLCKEGKKILLNGEHSKGAKRERATLQEQEQQPEGVSGSNIFDLVDFLFKK